MIRVIGIGSSFGADQLGWLAIEALQEVALPDLELIRLDRPGSGLLRYFEDVERVLLIDAVATDSEPGEVKLLNPADLSQASCLTSSHGFGVAEALALAKTLETLPAELWVAGIAAGNDHSSVPDLNKQQLLDLLARLTKDVPTTWKSA
ncbi:MAG: hydrogenase maturation protease [gamma proteobacterium endosymbiont of Lamellibrachia anaximandri]|nr:hydrogenase maturation protease [gamma proteobacterium endosymbiont of Lamellibrachia anaximandri]MBL3617816.1 hydrogenase maturation protease [gamma proteobacterium endosymbiont of Lamellibrachia anaximandri]